MNEEYREAFSEVSEILKLMPEELKNRIPEEFRSVLEKEKSKKYFPNIQEPIEEVALKKETIVILGLIHRDFLCSFEEKQRLYDEEKQELKVLNQELEEVKEKINYNDMLKNISKTKSENLDGESEKESNDKQMVNVSKEKWYKKLLNLFKRLFH